MLVTVEGSVNSVTEEQLRKAPAPTVSSPSGRTILAALLAETAAVPDLPVPMDKTFTPPISAGTVSV